jgi:hypothetical protein
MDWMDSTTTGGFSTRCDRRGLLVQRDRREARKLTIIKDQLGLKLRIAVEVRTVLKMYLGSEITGSYSRYLS